MSIVSLYATFASPEEAARIGRAMVEQRLAACVNILGPVRSIYRWHGEVEEADEVAAIFKTTGARTDALIAAIADAHSHEVPCIVAWPVERALPSYGQWVGANVG